MTMERVIGLIIVACIVCYFLPKDKNDDNYYDEDDIGWPKGEKFLPY